MDQGNNILSNVDTDLDPEKPWFWVFVLAQVVFITWMTLLIFYLSRIAGPIVAFFINRYLRFYRDKGQVRLGSFSISPLGGKIMFRNLVYVNEDYSLRINDGWIIFSYWKNVPSRDDLYKSNSSRLHISLNGFQFHLYNRTSRYQEIAKLFHLKKYFKDEPEQKKHNQPPDRSNSSLEDRLWVLFGVVRLDIWSGHLVVGNKLLPFMFELSWENMTSKIRIRDSMNDRAQLVAEGEMESVKGSFLRHPDYTGKAPKEPPKTMGDGFSVLQTAAMKFKWTQDLLGFETGEQQSPNQRQPTWQSYWEFGHHTVFSYGPWAEQQRGLLYGFFFPPDYQVVPATEFPKRCNRRIHVMHNVRIHVEQEASIDIWFMRGNQLESLLSKCQKGSVIELPIWWIVNEDGFSWSANFSLLNVVSITSLVHRRFFEAENLTIDCNFHYPRVYNAKQIWDFKFTISRATMWFLWDHKRFFADLMTEWSGEVPLDICSFVPYTISQDVKVIDGFEMIFMMNEGNWIDPAESKSENVEAAIVGESLNFSFFLPFVDFCPEMLRVTYTLSMTTGIGLRSRHPPSSATATLIAAIMANSHCDNFAEKSPWGSLSKQEHWYEIWRTEAIRCEFIYDQHPIITQPHCDLPLHVLHDMGIKRVRHPRLLAPDYLTVTMMIDGSEVYMTGLVPKLIIEMKNNYFGWHDSMTDATRAHEFLTAGQSMFGKVPTDAAIELYRPLNVDVTVRVHNIRAHCLIHQRIGETHECCPILYTEEIAVEVKKTFDDTIIQVGLGHCVAHFEKPYNVPYDGQITLSGLQFRGHALFSPEDVPWDMACLEYAWFLEVLVGDISGSLDIAHHVHVLQQIMEQMLLMTACLDDDKMLPERFNACQHGQLVSMCSVAKGKCESGERLKYRQMRIALDSVKLALCEEKTVFEIDLDPVRFTLCNAHKGRFTEHICIRIPRLTLRQALRVGEAQTWLCTASIVIDRVSLDIELPLADDCLYLEALRRQFVRKHDASTKRIACIYNSMESDGCACYGRTHFFGKKDAVGAIFLTKLKEKLCVSEVSEDHLGVLQDIIAPYRLMLKGEPHTFYKPQRKESFDAHPLLSGMPSFDTGSFHSANSNVRDVQSSNASSPNQAHGTVYTKYIGTVNVQMRASEPPRFGTPGDIARWAKMRTDGLQIGSQSGMNTLMMTSVAKKEGKKKEKKKEDTKADVGMNGPSRLAIKGAAAQNVRVFFSPLAAEGVERVVSALSKSLKLSHPCFLLQQEYRQCVMRNHKQPLTMSLFKSETSNPLVDVAVDLPNIHLSVFQCGAKDGLKIPSAEHTSSSHTMSMLFIVLDGNSITSTSSRQLNSTTFSLGCGMISSQLVHFCKKDSTDFQAPHSSFKSTVMWKDHSMQGILEDREPRVVMDVHIPDLQCTIEMAELGKEMTTQALASPIAPNAEQTDKNRGFRLSMGAFFGTVVMARPLERTAKNEFPLFDVLAPSITAWINVIVKLDIALEKMSSELSAWSDVSLARVLKLALDSTEQSPLGPLRSGKNMMEKVKRLGQNLASCPTCLLLHTVMRWCALGSAGDSLLQSVVVKGEFATEKARKTALMALLSHWHSDICQQVKLASNADASKFRAEAMRRETRIDMDNGHNGKRSSRSNSQSSKDSRSYHRPTPSGNSQNGNQNSHASKRQSHSHSQQEEPKLDLYHVIRSAHQAKNAMKKKKEMPKTDKDYVNPMELMPHAFFQPFYLSRRLEWTSLDAVITNHLQFTYSCALNHINVQLVEQRLRSSSDNQLVLTSCVQQLMHLGSATMDGRLKWNVEMDAKGLLPYRGLADIEYRSEVTDVSVAVALAAFCLVKEVMLVAKNSVDNLGECRRHYLHEDSPPSTAMSAQSIVTARSAENLGEDWEQRLLDMMRDFEKSCHRSAAPHGRGFVLTTLRGRLHVHRVRLTSTLTDLCVSFKMTSIEITQEHTPQSKYSKELAHGQKPRERTLDHAMIQLRRADLTLFEAERNDKNKPKQTPQQQHILSILSCSLDTSKAVFNRKLVMGKGPDGVSSLSVHFGALAGDLPMTAPALHALFTKHGREIEEQLDRLSAQPANLAVDGTLMPMSVAKLIPKSDEHQKPAHHEHIAKKLEETRKDHSRPNIAKVDFDVVAEGVVLSAQLLPSLRAYYKMNNAHSKGVSGNEAKFTMAIETHCTEFEVLPQSGNVDKFRLMLPAVAVNGKYSVEQGAAPSTTKQLRYREGGYLEMTVTLGQVNHSFTTDLLNHILFAEQTFRSELTLLVKKLQDEQQRSRGLVHAQLTPTENKPSMLFALAVKGTGVPWLQLTAATPTATAVRFTIDSIDMQLTNRWVVKEEGSTAERVFGAAVIQFNAKLGQLVKAAQYEEIQAELQEYATFMTQIRVENKEMLNQESYTYHITLNRPIFMLKSSAIDKGILLWLNYKNTYDFWRAERSKATALEKKQEAERAKETGVQEEKQEKRNSLTQTVLGQNQTQPQDFDVHLSLAITNGMYVCMPLFSYDVTVGIPALVLSLQSSDVRVTIRKELACEANFSNFRLSIIDQFDELAMTHCLQSSASQDTSNFFSFPEGTYELCSKASADTGDPSWVLSVRANMKGMALDLDNRIGYLSKMLATTLQSVGDHDYFPMLDKDSLDEELQDSQWEYAKEYRSLPLEERIPWLERRMHEQSTAFSELVANKAGETRVEQERTKLQHFELMRFREFRRMWLSRWKKSKEFQRKRASTSAEQFPTASSPMNIIADSGSTEESDSSATALSSNNDAAVSMHVDVQVSIIDGSCTLRTARDDKEKDKSMPKRQSARDLGMEGRRAKTLSSNALTRFLLPNVIMKGYYISAESINTSMKAQPNMKLSLHPAIAQKMSESTKDSAAAARRACFYLHLELVKMPMETIITPHLADYLEQVLEPTSGAAGASSVTRTPSEQSATKVSATDVPGNNMVEMDTSALPLDVIFFLNVQSSTMLFLGQQQGSSAADCKLVLPSLTLMATTRRMDGPVYLGGVDISATLSNFRISVYSPHQAQSHNPINAVKVELDHLSLVISRSKNASSEPDNRVRFVLTANIGQARFDYDMRRIAELIAFPKPWYRRAIMRRVLTGYQGAATGRGTDSFSRTTVPRQSFTAKQSSSKRSTETAEKPWQAAVLLAVQWNSLDVNAQMGNTMGTTRWQVKKGVLRSFAKLNSLQERDITVTFKLDSSSLTAHGGAISGEVELFALLLSATHKKRHKKPPKNSGRMEVGSVSTKVEWMSRAVLIAKCERPSLALGDEFHEHKDTKTNVVERVSVSLNLRGAWDDLQCVITRNTVDDFHKIVIKLNTFFLEQMKNSRAAWKSVQDSTSVSKLNASKSTSGEAEEPPKNHIQHWERVLDAITDVQSRLKLLEFPRGETVVGGSIELEAKRISLALMHGEMSTATSWATFHLRNPSILFSPEAQFYYLNKTKGTIGVSVRQRLNIRLGNVGESSHNQTAVTTENMANVCRVQQKGGMIRSNGTIDWYLEYLIGDVLKQLGIQHATPEQAAGTSKANHSVLELFQFPALEAVLTSVQSNECDTSVDSEQPLEVRSSFLCEFHNAVHVQTDFNAQVSFLPELIRNYAHHDEPAPGQAATQETAGSDSRDVAKRSDRRNFVCENWVVNPKIRFIDKITWQPPIIDEILKKLQIFDHRTTIPKALQRALLDPLDATLAEGLVQLLKTIDKGDKGTDSQHTMNSQEWSKGK